MTDTTNAKDETSAAIQPGDLKARLVACRDKAGLNLEQAAEEMHLSQHIVRALEAEDFAHLPEPPYVRGYLRSYAKLGEIDPQVLIRLYDTLRGAKPDDNKVGGQRHLVKTKVREKPPLSPMALKLAGSALIIMIVGLISLIPSVRSWASDLWASFSAQTNPQVVVRPAPAIETFAAKRASELAAEEAITPPVTTLANAAQATSSEDVPSTPTTIGSILSANTDNATANPTPPANNTTGTANAEKPATPEPPENTAKPADIPNTEAVDKAKAEAAKPTTTATSTNDKPTDTNSVVVPPVEAKPVSSTPPTPAATPTPPSTTVAAVTVDPNAIAATSSQPVVAPGTITGEVNIKLEFTDEVWMQIKDVKKKTLFESLNSAGTTQELKATTPLSFKIGNARGVKVYLNGQLYDQAPYTKGSVARFKLD